MMASLALLLLHGDGHLAPHDFWAAWTWEPLAAAGLVLGGTWYAVGVRRLRIRAGAGRGLAGWAPWCFGAGLAVVALALFSPLDRLGETLFAAHMVQHLLLMLVAAPLLALGAPPRALPWALPAGARRAAGRWWHRRALLARLGGVLVAPATAWALSAGALVFWHLPGPYGAALARDGVHAIEHLSFLGTGVLFWWVLLRPAGSRRLDAGLSVLYVFAAGLPGGLLGALLTFAGRPLYPGQSAAAGLWHLTPLEDQQLAGLIMWMPGGMVYFAAAAVFFVRWLRQEEARGARAAHAPAATALVLCLMLSAAVGCRPAEKAPIGEDSTRAAGPPAAAAESLPAGRAVQGSGFGRVLSIVGLSGPESVRYDPRQDLYFVSNFAGTLTAKDDNGFISRVRPDGTIDSLKFIAGGRGGVELNAPTGMALAGDTLWVADVTKVRAFDARTGAPLIVVDLGRFRPRLLNDVELGPDGAVYVTDTGIRFGGNGGLEHPGPDRIFRIAPGGRAAVAARAGLMEGPNGIAWDGPAGRFIVVSFTARRIYGWAPRASRAVTLAEGPGKFDGVVVLPGGRALVTSWADSSLYLLAGDSLARVLTGLPEPADLGLDTRRGRVAIPVSSENRVEVWAVPGTAQAAGVANSHQEGQDVAASDAR